jgi:hypothetical protein
LLSQGVLQGNGSVPYMVRAVLAPSGAKELLDQIPAADLSGMLQRGKSYAPPYDTGSATAYSMDAKASAANTATALTLSLSGMAFSQGPDPGVRLYCSMTVDPVMSGGVLVGLTSDAVMCRGFPEVQYPSYSPERIDDTMTATAVVDGSSYSATGTLVATSMGGPNGYGGTQPMGVSLQMRDVTVVGSPQLFRSVFNPTLPTLPMWYGSLSGVNPNYNSSLQVLFAAPRMRTGNGPYAYAQALVLMQSQQGDTTRFEMSSGSINVQPTGNYSSLNLKLSGYASWYGAAVVEYPSDACGACAACVAAVRQAMLPVANATSAPVVAAHGAKVCQQLLQDEAMCSKLVAAVNSSRNGAAGKRPGYLCMLAGQCVRLEMPAGNMWGDAAPPSNETGPPGDSAGSGGALGGSAGGPSIAPGEPYGAQTPIKEPVDKTPTMAPPDLAAPSAAPPAMEDKPAPMAAPMLDATAGKPPTRRLLQMLAGSDNVAPDMAALAYATVGVAPGGPGSPDNSSSAPGNASMPMLDAGGIPRMVEMVRGIYYAMGGVYMPPAVLSDGTMCPPSFMPNAAVKGATPVDMCTTDGSFMGPQVAGTVNLLSESSASCLRTPAAPLLLPVALHAYSKDAHLHSKCFGTQALRFLSVSFHNVDVCLPFLQVLPRCRLGAACWATSAFQGSAACPTLHPRPNSRT